MGWPQQPRFNPIPSLSVQQSHWIRPQTFRMACCAFELWFCSHRSLIFIRLQYHVPALYTKIMPSLKTQTKNKTTKQTPHFHFHSCCSIRNLFVNLVAGETTPLIHLPERQVTERMPYLTWLLSNPLRMVTHRWSTNISPASPQYILFQVCPTCLIWNVLGLTPALSIT